MAQHRDLEHPAMRLLVHMAALALDPPGTRDLEPLVYFGGWQLQAWHLGLDVPDGTDTASVTRQETCKRITARWRGQLARAGAIVLVKHSAPGRTAIWRIQVELEQMNAGVRNR